MSLKIVYCLPSLYIPGGMERVLTVKANYLADIYGYEIYIILTDGEDRTPYYALSQKVKILNLAINYDDLNGKSFAVKTLGYFRKQKIYKRKLREYLMQIKPDITISMLRREINFINKIKDGSVKVGEIHINRDHFRDLYGNIIKRLLSRVWMSQLLRELKKLDHFVVLSHEDQQKWPEIKNISVIHNPLSFFPIQASECKNHEVIAVGRYVYQKGFDMLIDAWKLVVESHPDWVLRIYGAGDREVYEEQVYDLELENNCFLESSVSNIVEKYLDSSIFVLSSRFEGWGLVITEAMACGLPVVSFDCPCGPKDIITDGEDGYLVGLGDTKIMADKINQLIENESVRQSMGRNSKRNAEKFKIDNIARQWDDLFVRLIRTGHKII
jgi:glycosyltransferase involved in cell wall biosynthesis